MCPGSAVPIIASRYLGTQLLKVFHRYSRLCHLPVCQFGIMDSSERVAAAKTKVANLVTFSLPIFPEMSSRSQETCLWITSVYPTNRKLPWLEDTDSTVPPTFVELFATELRKSVTSLDFLIANVERP